MMRRVSRKKGFSAVELIVYIALLGFVAMVTTNTILVMSKVLGTARLERRVTASADAAIRRMVRELHLANAVNASSVLDASPGVLDLASAASEDDATPTEVAFSVTNGVLMLQRGSSAAVPLTADNVSVTNLVFRKITNGSHSTSVKTEMTLSASAGRVSVSRNYEITVILRGSYAQ